MQEDGSSDRVLITQQLFLNLKQQIVLLLR